MYDACFFWPPRRMPDANIYDASSDHPNTCTYIHDTGSFRDRQTDKHIPGLGYELNIDLKSLKGGGRHKSTM